MGLEEFAAGKAGPDGFDLCGCWREREFINLFPIKLIAKNKNALI